MSDKAQNEALDRELGAALAKYAAVQPRAGMEERILANLRAQQRPTTYRWWQWAVGGALAAIIGVALALALRQGKPMRQQIANRPAPVVEGEAGRVVSPNIPKLEQALKVARQTERPASGTNPSRVDRLAASLQPKLDQFPSPQPLTEQERILARYVARHPEYAALIARAQAEILRRDADEDMNDAAQPGETDLPH